MSYVDLDVWSCPHPGCNVTVRGNSRARRTTRQACARRHGANDDGQTASEVAPTMAALAIPKAPKNGRRGPRKRS